MAWDHRDASSSAQAPIHHADDPAARRSIILIGGATLLALAIPTAWLHLKGLHLAEAQTRADAAAWWACFALFTAAWLWSALTGRRGRTAVIALVVQSLSALAANWILPTVFSGVAIGGLLLMMVAAQLAILPPTLAYVWIGVQSVTLLAIYFGARWPAHVSVSAAGAYAAGQLAMLGIGRMAERQRTLRAELAQTVAELLSTRALLAENARSAERLRIARELHDVLGHHLVAMRLQLEAAALEADASPAARQRIAEAAAMARLLLADVRAAVSDLREGTATDLTTSLQALATGVPGPAIDLRVEDGFDAGAPERAAALLRCAQEAVTNARRHADASRIEISLAGETLRVRDDGRGMTDAVPGSGLRGMRERVEALGGTLDIAPAPGGGTEVRVAIPRRLDPAVALRLAEARP